MSSERYIDIPVACSRSRWDRPQPAGHLARNAGYNRATTGDLVPLAVVGGHHRISNLVKRLRKVPVEPQGQHPDDEHHADRRPDPHLGIHSGVLEQDE